MADKPKDNSGVFGNDELDEEVTSADDTGIVKQQQEIAEEEILSHLKDD
ncbi:MAG TPA: hypothetical protein VFO29_03865 [Candidatus Rubrimentiphilum sp.]|nr:hypothetical protein [Candidatus Rubrimentiphilum sp.]